MVRLKALPCPKPRIPSHWFQFHNGPIKSWISSTQMPKPEAFQFHNGPIKSYRIALHLLGVLSFQFHNGPIKRLMAMGVAVEDVSFNSTMVRLKASVCRL